MSLNAVVWRVESQWSRLGIAQNSNQQLEIGRANKQTTCQQGEILWLGPVAGRLAVNGKKVESGVARQTGRSSPAVLVVRVMPQQTNH